METSIRITDCPSKERIEGQNSKITLSGSNIALQTHWLPYTNKLLYDRLCLEIELYNLRHEEPEKL